MSNRMQTALRLWLEQSLRRVASFLHIRVSDLLLTVQFVLDAWIMLKTTRLIDDSTRIEIELEPVSVVHMVS